MLLSNHTTPTLFPFKATESNFVVLSVVNSTAVPKPAGAIPASFIVPSEFRTTVLPLGNVPETVASISGAADIVVQLVLPEPPDVRTCPEVPACPLSFNELVTFNAGVTMVLSFLFH